MQILELYENPKMQNSDSHPNYSIASTVGILLGTGTHRLSVSPFLLVCTDCKLIETDQDIRVSTYVPELGKRQWKVRKKTRKCILFRALFRDPPIYQLTIDSPNI